MKKYKLLYKCYDLVKETILYDQRGWDYGLSSDDTRISGVQHISVTKNSNGDYPGYSIPVNALQEIE